jgi:four helix bundle protein
MTKISSFRDLEVWSSAMALAVHCYRATEPFPASELYGLTAQIRRAAASIPANLAEGHSRSRNVFRNHVSIAIGSQAEVDTLLELALRLDYLERPDHVALDEPLRRTGQMLHALARALNPPGSGALR